MVASLYIHVPFCAGACDYCDFYSVAADKDDDRLNRYTELVSRDVVNQIYQFSVDTIPSIYIGGGTPSMLGASGISRLMKAISPAIKTWPGEISIEANPESVNRDFIQACMDTGISRISLGVQSFSAKSRRAVNRTGSARTVPEALSLLRDVWRGNFSVDLITGLPFQDEQTLHEDIKKVVSYGPAHISLYSLILEEGTVLKEKAGKHEIILPGDDEADSLWLLGKSLLEESGYVQYEVSNFSRPRGECLHNIRYWRMENWLGAGPGASGTIFDDPTGTAVRRTVPADIETFLTGTLEPRMENINRMELIKEMILMGFRYIEGPGDILIKKRSGGTWDTLIPETLRRWRNNGLIREDRTALTREGLVFLNRFVGDAFFELDRG